jgi:hypothetical protein
MKDDGQIICRFSCILEPFPNIFSYAICEQQANALMAQLGTDF